MSDPQHRRLKAKKLLGLSQESSSKGQKPLRMSEGRKFEFEGRKAKEVHKVFKREILLWFLKARMRKEKGNGSKPCLL